MLQVMTGQGFDRSSGVQGLLTRGQEGHRRTVSAGTVLTAVELLAGRDDTLALPDGEPDRLPVVVPPGHGEVVLDPGWLVDLHDPTLVISHGYVGPDRRRVDRTWDELAPPGGRRGRFLRRVVQIAVMTVVFVASLTVIASRSVPPAATGTPPAVTKAAPATTDRGQRTQHTFGATPRQIARADAAYERTLARVQAAPSPAAVSGRAAAAAATHVTQAARQASVAAAAAEARAQAKSQAAQARAAAQAAAAQRRAAQAAARAAARAARHGGTQPSRPSGGSSGTGGSSTTGTTGGGTSGAPAGS